MAKKKQSRAPATNRTSDGIKILHDRYLRGDAEMTALVDEERANAELAARLRSLREKSGLSQRALAKLVGTTASAICRLEDAEYSGHSLAMLKRVAAALDRRIEIRFLPAR